MTKKNAKVKAANESDEYLDELKHRILDNGLTLCDAMVMLESDVCPDPYDQKYWPTYLELAKLRFDYIMNHPESTHLNFYIDTGAEGSVLTIIATMLMLGFITRDYEHPLFVTGDPKISLEDYAGEPVIIFANTKASDMLRACVNPSVDYIFTDLHMLNLLTFVAGPESYEEFLSGLGENYVDGDGKVLTANEIAPLISRF